MTGTPSPSPPTSPKLPVVLSGIQPTGELHIGNYLGAVIPWVRGQAASRNYFCVVDLHALTVPRDPAQLHAATRRLTAMYLACGIDPDVSTVFVQSHVTAHAQLGWILSCLTPMGWLERMTQFKEKSRGQEAERVSAGLFCYPSLMAADILLYQANHVPVGDDQRQHLELARDLATRFNHRFGDTFVIPTALIPTQGQGARVMSLEDPTRKMSKSVPDGCIFLTDTADATAKKVMRAVTDSGSRVDPANLSPGLTNLLAIAAGLEAVDTDTLTEQFAGQGYGVLKKSVAATINERLEPVRARFEALTHDTNHLDAILHQGASAASAVADRTLDTVKERVGLLLPH